MTTFTTIFLTSSLCLLTYVRIKKIEGGIFYDVSMSPRPKKKNQTHYLILFIRAYNGAIFFQNQGYFLNFFGPKSPPYYGPFSWTKIVNGNLRAPIALFLTKRWPFFGVFLPKTTNIISVFYFLSKNTQVYRPNLWKKIVFCCKITLIIWLLALLFFLNKLL